MKKSSVFWGLVLIMVAVLLLLNGIGPNVGAFVGDIPIVSIVLGVLCVAWAVSELIKLNIAGIFFPLAFVFLLFEQPIARLCGVASGELISNWLVLVSALLLTIGTGVIFHSPKSYKSWEDRGNGHTNCSSNSLGGQLKYIDSSNFEYQHIDNSLGSIEVFFENTEQYKGGGVLELENNMGKIQVNIPAAWCVVSDGKAAMGSIQCDIFAHDGPTLTVRSECNMGCIVLHAV